MRMRGLILPFVFTIATLGLLTGCEESVNPVLGTDQQFTLYGFLNPMADTQAVRIFDIDNRLQQTIAEPMDASVYLMDLETGERVEWQDSIVHYLDESIGHVFWVHYQPVFDRRYRLIAEGSGGLQTEAEIRTPPRAEPALGNITSAPANVLIEVDWIAAPRILQTRVVYHMRTRLRNDSRIFERKVTLNTGSIDQSNAGFYTVTVEPSRDIGFLYELLSLRPGIDEIALDSLGIEAFVAGEDWDPPVPGFDPELLVQPGTFTNVSNGFGFVGSGYFDTFRYVPTDEVRQDAGFSLLND